MCIYLYTYTEEFVIHKLLVGALRVWDEWKNWHFIVCHLVIFTNLNLHLLI